MYEQDVCMNTEQACASIHTTLGASIKMMKQKITQLVCQDILQVSGCGLVQLLSSQLGFCVHQFLFQLPFPLPANNHQRASIMMPTVAQHKWDDNFIPQ